MTALVVVALVVAAVVAWPTASPHARSGRSHHTAGGASVQIGERIGGSTTTSTTPLDDPVFARVLVVGDSLGVDLGDQLFGLLAPANDVTTVAAKGDTGLDDPAFYDWPSHLASLVATDDPTLVVVLLGANDHQGLYADGTAVAPGSSAWDRAYAGRVHTMLAEATASGAEVAWVGAPPMADPTLDRWMGHIDGIFQHQTSRFARALYVDSTPVLGTASGAYQESASDGTVLRTSDGVHLTSGGASLLATAVIAAVGRADTGGT
jgi:hypothetical protein